MFKKYLKNKIEEINNNIETIFIKRKVEPSNIFFSFNKCSSASSGPFQSTVVLIGEYTKLEYPIITFRYVHIPKNSMGKFFLK